MKIELDARDIDRLSSEPCVYQIRYEGSGNGWVSMRYGFEDKQPDGGQCEKISPA